MREQKHKIAIMGRAAFRGWKRDVLAARRADYAKAYRPIGGWKPVLGYEGKYEVNDQGQVRSLLFRGYPRAVPVILQQYEHESGYHSVTLVDACGKTHTKHIHRLILEAFVGLPPKGYVAGHRDGDGRHNVLSNLEWITYHDNEVDKRRHGRSLQGERNHQSKLTATKVRAMRQMRARMAWPYSKLGRIFGVSTPVAHKICQRKSWQHVA